LNPNVAFPIDAVLYGEAQVTNCMFCINFLPPLISGVCLSDEIAAIRRSTSNWETILQGVHKTERRTKNWFVLIQLALISLKGFGKHFAPSNLNYRVVMLGMEGSGTQ
jgi:hypothetical protein